MSMRGSAWRVSSLCGGHGARPWWLVVGFAVLVFAGAAQAQRLDLDGPAAPDLPRGSVLSEIADGLRADAEAFRIELRALGDDAPEVELLAMRCRAAFGELLAGWLVDVGPDAEAAAVRHTAALAFAGELPRFNRRCQAIVRDNDAVRHAGAVLALESLLCLTDPECRPMLRATALDDHPDDPLIRAVGGALAELLGDDAADAADSGVVLRDPVAELAAEHGWAGEIVEGWASAMEAWSARAAVDPAFGAWMEAHLSALGFVLGSISADATPRDAAVMDAARDLMGALMGADAAGAGRTLASVLRDAGLTERTIRAIDALGASPPDQRTAAPDREAVRTARRAAQQRWLSGELPAGHLRVVVALERIAAQRVEADRPRARSAEPPGPMATERRWRSALASIEDELLRSIPLLLTDRSRLAHPEIVSLLARHQSTAGTLIDYLDLPARRVELRMEQDAGLDALLIGRVNNQLGRAQRETAANDPASAERAHRLIGAHARLHAAYRALTPSDLAALAFAIDRPGLARVDWGEALANQRRAALAALADADGNESGVALALEIAERLEAFASLGVMARTDRSALARPLHRHFSPSIELALTALRDNAFGRALEPMATVRLAGAALGELRRLLDADPVAAGALAAMLGQDLADSPVGSLRGVGRPWGVVGPSRAANASAVRWLGELDRAAIGGGPSAELQRIAEHALQQLQRASHASERGQ